MKNKIMILIVTMSLILSTTIISIATDDHGLMSVQPIDKTIYVK